MKTKLLFLLCVATLFLACKPINPPDKPDQPDKPDNPEQPDNPPVVVDSLSVSLLTINFNEEEDASLVVVQTNKSWTATKHADWIKLSAASGDKNTGFLIAADRNESFKRNSSVTIRSGEKTVEINVIQSGTSVMNLDIKGVDVRMILVEGSEFVMGSNELSIYGLPHRVKLDDFYIAETETTNELWMAIQGSLPYTGHSENNQLSLPVSMVNWNQVVNDFIPELNKVSAKNFRLPTEAEWEYAAMGGKKSKGFKYSGSNTLDDVAWYYTNSGSLKKDVKLRDANELGIYDMSGNVAEWCSDWFDEYYGFPIVDGVLTVPDLQTNPTGPESGTEKLLRGGSVESSFSWERINCHVKHRVYTSPSYSNKDIGFRLVLTN